MGRQAYDAMLRDEQLLPLDSRDVERMANDELAHDGPRRRGSRRNQNRTICRSARRAAVAWRPMGRR